MKKQLRKLTFLAFSCVTTMTAFSQNYLGVHSSNYAGVMGLDVQPASFVDGRFIVDINLASVNVGAWQNAKYFKTDVMLLCVNEPVQPFTSVTVRVTS